MNKIIEIKFGSHLYGTDTPNSDLDFKGIYLPTAKEICLGNYKETISTVRPKQTYERNTKEDVDIEIFSLDRYLKLLTEGQTVSLDMLFAPENMYVPLRVGGFSNYIFKTIKYNKDKLLNKNINAFVGYARQQAAKYGQKGFRVHALRETLEWLNCYPDTHTLLTIGADATYRWICEVGNDHIEIVECKGPNNTMSPHLYVCGKKYPFHATVKYIKAQVQRRFDEYGKRALLAEKNEGVDWKALSHAVRVNTQAKELLETGNITFPRPDRELLLKIKTGQMDYKEVAEIIEEGLETLEHSQSISTLPESPDYEWVDNFIYSVYSDIVKGVL